MHYVIIGANAAGLSAAVRIRKLCPDAKVTVFEKTDVVSFGACGIPYFVGNEFDNIDMVGTPKILNIYTPLLRWLFRVSHLLCIYSIMA